MNGRIKEIRKYLRLNQEDFGRRLGVTVTAISKIEKGTNGITDQMLLAVCREYNVNEDWLRTGDGSMFVQNEITELAYLAREYDLDTLDRKIIQSYLRLSKYQRQSIKRFIMDVSESEAEMEAAEESAPSFPQKDLTPKEQADLLRARADAIEKGSVYSTILEKDA